MLKIWSKNINQFKYLRIPFQKLNFSSEVKKRTECYYKILNVSTTATLAEIKESYYALSKLYHPDTNIAPATTPNAQPSSPEVKNPHPPKT
jgi:hypothetical protein